jgi:hypothetical protein
MSETNQELIMSFSKNSLEQVRLSFQTYKGRRFFDLRVWYAEEPEVWQPTKKGLTLSLDLLGDLKKAVDAALAKIAFEEEAKAGEQGSGSEAGEEGKNG